MCKEKTQEINALLSRIQQSVKTLAVYSIEQLESVERLKTDSEYINAYTQKLESGRGERRQQHRRGNGGLRPLQSRIYAADIGLVLEQNGA